MINKKISSNEAGILLSRNEKKEFMREYVHRLLTASNDIIDQGLFDDHFCPSCVIELLQRDVKVNEVSLTEVSTYLPKEGKFKEYKIGGYRFDDYLSSYVVPVDSFDTTRMRTNKKFKAPVSGKANIAYPFNDLIFELDIVNANSVGEILSIISIAYEAVFDFAEECGINFIHIIEELSFEDSIRIYENGTIEFHVGS